jgi:hypothetical protein
MAYDYDRRTTNNEVSLRKAVIRLAHAKPELRPHLLPLVKEAARVGAPIMRLIEQWGGFPDIDQYFGGSRVTPWDAREIDAGFARKLSKIDPTGVWYMKAKAGRMSRNEPKYQHLGLEDHFKINFTRMATIGPGWSLE